MKNPSFQLSSLRNRILAGAAVLAILGSQGAQAAVIIWNPATISGETDVSTEGVFKQALNIGNTVNVTLNGVNFTAATPGNSTSTLGTGEGAITLTMASGNWSNYNANTFAPNPAGANPFGSLSTSYQTFLQSATSPSQTSATYTVLNLTIGQEYLIQLWVNDSRGIVATRENTLTAGNSVIMDFNVLGTNGGLGTVVTGRFTADSASQLISVSATNGTPHIQLNGYQLRAVPEPSALALAGFAIGIVAFLRRRRRSCGGATA